MDVLSALPLLTALATLAALTGRWWGSWTHPAPLVTVQWLAVSACALLLPHGLRPAGMQVLLLMLLAVCSFVVGSLLARRCEPRSVAFRAMDGSWGRTSLANALLLLALFGLPAFLLKAQELAESAAFTESFYVNLRIALTGELDDAQSFGLAGYLIPISFTSALVELVSSPRRWPSARFWLTLALALTYAVMATGRTFVFLLGISLAFVCLLQGRMRPVQIVLLSLVFVLAAFVGLGLIANKIGADSPNVDALGVGDALALYLLGSLTAMDVHMTEPLALQWGANTFRSFLAIAQGMGLSVEVPNLVKPYVFIPQPTNVYTVLRPYWDDFGWLGVIGAFTLFGWAHSTLYSAAQKCSDPRLQVLTALAMYPLLMQFFQDQYFSLLTTWVIFFVLVWPSLRRQRL